MKTNTILIVEDEQIIAENLRYILNEYGYNLVDVASDSDEAEDLFKTTSYDLVLMDINLGDVSIIDGVDLIKKLTVNYTFAHMYVTANADVKTVTKAKETNPSGYIVKPFLNTAIYANVTLALNSIEKVTFLTYCNNQGKYEKVSSHKITYIQADGAYCNLNLYDNQQLVIRKSLAEITQLYPNLFIRIHKSILINKEHIQNYTSKFVEVNNHKLALGRTYKDSFLDELT